MFTMVAQFHWIAVAGLFVLSVAFVVLFVIIETRHVNPIIPLKLIKNPIADIISLNLINSII